MAKGWTWDSVGALREAPLPRIDRARDAFRCAGDAHIVL
jgi:hypothetical protein